LTVLTLEEYWKSPVCFDAAFSISSFEHSGLGRFGDKLNPEGDLEAMSDAGKMIRSDGILYLSVPIGKDRLIWNAHRIYGPIRLPMLLKEWELVDSFGFDKSLFGQDGYVQPIFVLKKRDR